MRVPHARLTLRWIVAAATCVGVVAVLAAFERSKVLRRDIAILRSENAYQRARLAREHAERALKDYSDQTFPQELARAGDEIKQAEQELTAVMIAAAPELKWRERIRSKGYLLHITGGGAKLAVPQATFAVEQARLNKRLLESYVKDKILKELKSEFTSTQQEESHKKAAYDQVRATRVGFVGTLMGRD